MGAELSSSRSIFVHAVIGPVKGNRKCGEVYELLLGDQDKGVTSSRRQGEQIRPLRGRHEIRRDAHARILPATSTRFLTPS